MQQSLAAFVSSSKEGTNETLQLEDESVCKEAQHSANARHSRYETGVEQAASLQTRRRHIPNSPAGTREHPSGPADVPHRHRCRLPQHVRCP